MLAFSSCHQAVRPIRTNDIEIGLGRLFLSISSRRCRILWIQYAIVKPKFFLPGCCPVTKHETRPPATQESRHRNLPRGLGLLDSVVVVVGAMVGSGVFIVPAEIARQVGGAGWRLVDWGIAGTLAIAAALSYGGPSGVMPHAGGTYYPREACSPLRCGWTLFSVIIHTDAVGPPTADLQTAE